MGRPRIDFPINLGGPLTFANNITINGNLTLEGNVSFPTTTDVTFSGPAGVVIANTGGLLVEYPLQVADGIQFISVIPHQTNLLNNARFTWTPTLQGSGGTAGAYAQTASGIYYQIGNLLVASGQIVLTNKGSWTGVPRIVGLPEVADPLGMIQVVNIQNPGGFVGLVGPLSGIINAGSSLINLAQEISFGSATNLLDYATNISNTTALNFCAVVLMASTID